MKNFNDFNLRNFVEISTFIVDFEKENRQRLEYGFNNQDESIGDNWCGAGKISSYFTFVMCEIYTEYLNR